MLLANAFAFGVVVGFMALGGVVVLIGRNRQRRVAELERRLDKALANSPFNVPPAVLLSLIVRSAGKKVAPGLWEVRFDHEDLSLIRADFVVAVARLRDTTYRVLSGDHKTVVEHVEAQGGEVNEVGGGA